MRHNSIKLTQISNTPSQTLNGSKLVSIEKSNRLNLSNKDETIKIRINKEKTLRKNKLDKQANDLHHAIGLTYKKP
ncbi:MAG: hypothetical protein A3E88_03930 [Legionellales bacterium RIFCSPHIGHO2_12_FULL_35_11]|nr:MAG: hypothetical protein A3E88_03930 [Legionellales bacterium RIFCSPHIGHO2_12_FULL_35_11]